MTFLFQGSAEAQIFKNKLKRENQELRARVDSLKKALTELKEASQHKDSIADEMIGVYEENTVRTAAGLSPEDYTQELFRTWQICEGNFVPYNTYDDTKMFPLVVKPGKAIKAVREGKYKLVCLNDNVHIRNYDRVMSSLEESFKVILPEKSSFEK